MSKKAVYISKSTIKSLWQKYFIYEDRVEFNTHFGKLVVPFENIEGVYTSESDAKGLLRGDLHLKNFRPALKLDWANFVEHIILDKKEGCIKRILFTPDNVVEFKRVLNKALTVYKEKAEAVD